MFIKKYDCDCGHFAEQRVVEAVEIFFTVLISIYKTKILPAINKITSTWRKCHCKCT
jgi:hypothetical protein